MMALTEQKTAVPEEVVRKHLAGWHAFTQFVTVNVIAVIALLVLMAIFLL